MDDGKIFVLMIVIVLAISGVAKMWVKARHGLPLEHPRRRQAMNRYRARHGWPSDDDEIDNERKVRLLSDENEKLVGKIGRLEERLAVLERIATDPATRTAQEIEALRDR